MFRKSSRWDAGRADAHDVDGHTEFTSVPFREELVTPKPYPRFRVSGGASRTFGERDPRGKTSGLGGKKPFFSYLKMRLVATRGSESVTVDIAKRLVRQGTRARRDNHYRVKQINCWRRRW